MHGSDQKRNNVCVCVSSFERFRNQAPAWINSIPSRVYIPQGHPPPGHFQFLIFDFQNIENCFPISCFLETKIDDWDCKFVIFNSWGIKHWKSRLWIFDFQFSIWNKNQMDENHTDRTQRQFSENICSKEDLRSRFFGTFVV